MPRSRSCSIQSVTVVPSCTSPILWIMPVQNSTRSVIVVLPASICAAIPMFRVRSSGNLRFGEFGPAAADFFFSSVAGINLPAEMRKRAIRLRHFMRVFAFLDRVALTCRCVLDFLSERLRHRHALASVRVLDDPTRRQRNLARGRHFQWDLISRATDPTRFYFQARTNVLDCFVYDFEWID